MDRPDDDGDDGGGSGSGSSDDGLPIEIVALVVSPGHNYWFHSRDPRDGVGPHPTSYPESVEFVAGQGIVGDRFYGRTSGLASAVSFLAAEAVDEVGRQLGLPPFPAAGGLDPRLLRRNVVVRGVDLNALRHRHFSITQQPTAQPLAPRPSGDEPSARVEFVAAGETSPCAWMDAVLAPGARDLLRGRGGLRTEPTTSGVLRLGPAVLHAWSDSAPDQLTIARLPVPTDLLGPSHAADRVRRRPLP
jgi:hypothetical protein